jgi:hypothetical protein
MMFETQVLAWDSNKNVAGQNWLMGSQNSPFDNWITNDNTNKSTNKKPVQIRFQSKRPTTFTKMDNINMDSTIACSVTTS